MGNLWWKKHNGFPVTSLVFQKEEHLKTRSPFEGPDRIRWGWRLRSVWIPQPPHLKRRCLSLYTGTELSTKTRISSSSSFKKAFRSKGLVSEDGALLTHADDSAQRVHVSISSSSFRTNCNAGFCPLSRQYFHLALRWCGLSKPLISEWMSASLAHSETASAEDVEFFRRTEHQSSKVRADWKTDCLRFWPLSRPFSQAISESESESTTVANRRFNSGLSSIAIAWSHGLCGSATIHTT